MNKILMFGVLSFWCVYLQASDKSTFIAISEQIEGQRSPEYLQWIAKPKQQAIFNGIQQGFDNDFLQVLLNASCRTSPSQECSDILKKEVYLAVRTYSPGVVELKRKINCGGTPAALREELRQQLDDFLNS